MCDEQVTGNGQVLVVCRHMAATDPPIGAQQGAGRFKGFATSRALSAHVPDLRVADLAKRYDTIRWTMPSGYHRTQQMTEVANQIEDGLSGATDFDVVGHLGHEDRGVRLAAYAYLRKHASPDLLSTLVDAAVGEDKPFGRHCALRAQLHQVATGAHPTERDRRALRAMRNRAGAHTDRGMLVSDLVGV